MCLTEKVAWEWFGSICSSIANAGVAASSASRMVLFMVASGFLDGGRTGDRRLRDFPERQKGARILGSIPERGKGALGQRPPLQHFLHRIEEIARIVARFQRPAPEALAGEREQNPRDFARRPAVGSPGRQRLAGDFPLELDEVTEAPFSRQLPGRAPRLYVVEEPDPERGESMQIRRWNDVGAAHLDDALDAHLGKERG